MATARVLSAEERARRIRRWIRRGEERLVERFAVLRHQNAMGVTLLVMAASGMVVSGWLYWTGRIPGYVCILLNAFSASILHEIEHDLIHYLYYRKRPIVHNAMMFFVWAFRGNVPHGWYRRTIHFHHHGASGTHTDVEERLVGLGIPWGFRRFVVSVDGLMSVLLNGRDLRREIPGFRHGTLFLASLPFYPLFLLVLFSFIIYHAAILLGITPSAPSVTMQLVYPWLDLLAIAWVFPNYLRQAALQIVSSNCHYYDDVGNITEETQILRPFYLWPLQLFCFNFGTTHCFHHYVVEQPFYIRQLITPWVLPAMRKYGVRENDTGTFWRANRFRTS